jgi:hypothetical protein
MPTIMNDSLLSRETTTIMDSQKLTLVNPSFTYLQCEKYLHLLIHPETPLYHVSSNHRYIQLRSTYTAYHCNCSAEGCIAGCDFLSCYTGRAIVEKVRVVSG